MDENIFENEGMEPEIIEESSSDSKQDIQDAQENAFESEISQEPEPKAKSEFEIELENYLPTPENTDKVKKPLPKWFIPALVSCITCIVLFIVHALLILPNMRPYAVISYVNSQNPTQGSIIPENNNADVLYSSAIPGIVTVESTSSYQSFFGLSSNTNKGTGIVISPDGYILTTVTASAGKDHVVTLSGGKEYTATVVGYDETKDIAILKIDAGNLPALTLGDSDSLRIGEGAVVISNMLSSKELGPSVTTGIICGINSGVAIQGGSTVNLIQTDALTGSASSGGCILNANGEIVGMITSAFTSETDGISFAIPSNDIKAVSESLISTGKAPEGVIIGITGTDSTHGVLIESITEGSPASKADLKIGDLILKVQDTPVTSISEINKIRDKHKKGDTLKITIYREGNIIDVNIVL